MEYFKILTQSKYNAEEFSVKYKAKFKRIIFGKSGNSFGISYTPNDYSKLLAEDEIFHIFVKESIKQLLMNNWRFARLLEFSCELQISVVDCTIKDIKLEEILEDDVFGKDFLLDYLSDNENEITKMKFRTKEKYLVTIMNNGVIGVDEELIDSNDHIVSRLLDFVSYGKVS